MEIIRLPTFGVFGALGGRFFLQLLASKTGIQLFSKYHALGIEAMADHFFKNGRPKRFWPDYFGPKTFEATAQWRKARPDAAEPFYI